MPSENSAAAGGAGRIWPGFSEAVPFKDFPRFMKRLDPGLPSAALQAPGKRGTSPAEAKRRAGAQGQRLQHKALRSILRWIPDSLPLRSRAPGKGALLAALGMAQNL